MNYKSPSDFFSQLTMSYNDSYLHILPELFNILSNSLLLQRVPQTSSWVTTTSHMLPTLQSKITWNAGTFFSPFLLGMVLSVIPAVMFLELVMDREIKARNLLRLNGVSFNLYFSSFFIVIFTVCFVAYLSLLILIQAFQVDSLVLPPAFANVALLYLLYIITILPFGGTITYLFDKSETARSFLPNLISTLGLLAYSLVAVLDLVLPSSNAGFICHCVVAVVLPIYLPYGAVYYINKVYLNCSLFSTCDDVTFGDYMTTEIIIMYVMCVVNAVVYYVLLRVADALKTGGSLRDALFLSAEDTPEDTNALLQEKTVLSEQEDEDVKVERKRVQDILRSDGGVTPPALVYNLGKTYSETIKSK